MNYNSIEITTLVNTIANLIAANLNDESLGLAATIFTQLGDTLATIASVNSITSTDENEQNQPEVL